MKTQNERPNLPEMPPYRLGWHRNTIQAYLMPGIKDDIGEFSEEMKKFGVMHGSHGSSEIEAREKGVTRKRDAKDAERPTETRIERQQRQKQDLLHLLSDRPLRAMYRTPASRPRSSERPMSRPPYE